MSVYPINLRNHCECELTNCLPQSERRRWGGDLLDITTVAVSLTSDTSSSSTTHTLSDRRLSPLLTCPPHVPLVNKSVVHSALCSTLNSCSTLNDFLTRKFVKADTETDFRLQSVYFLLPVFSFSLSLPFLSHSFYSLPLSFSASTGRAPFFYYTAWIRRTGPVRSTLSAWIHWFFVMYIDGYKMRGLGVLSESGKRRRTKEQLKLIWYNVFMDCLLNT